MRWPWVSRGRYDELKEHAQFLCEQLSERQRMVENGHRFTSDLIDKLQALKLQGATVPEPQPTIERKELDPVQAAITAKAGPDRKLRAMMSREAMQSRAAGIPDIEILQAIEQGVTVDDEGVV